MILPGQSLTAGRLGLASLAPAKERQHKNNMNNHNQLTIGKETGKEVKNNMPNWCENTMTVTGEENEVQRFKELAKPKDQKMDSDLSLESLYPIADKEDWYHWCIAHWGTKWDVEATLDELSPDYLEYHFGSAWSPPIDWLKEIAQRFPTLRFQLKYDEPSMGFMGVAIADNGELIKDESLSYY